jgi:hypothetical protein
MIIVPNLRWRTFRYWAVRASDVHGIESRWELGNSSTDFNLKKTNINPRSTCKPASTHLPVASSLQHPCNNNVLLLFLPVPCTKSTINQKRVACRHQTFNSSQAGSKIPSLSKSPVYKICETQCRKVRQR